MNEMRQDNNFNLMSQIIIKKAARAMTMSAPIKSFSLCFAQSDCFLILLA